MIFARAFILVWFLVAFALSVAGWFERFSAAALFGIGTLASAVGFTVLHWISAKFRGFLRARSLKRMTMGQALRFFGLLAFFKADQDVLPALFAIPTALIDVAFASTSFLVAARLISTAGRPKRGFFVWHISGLAGLAVSVTLAILTSSNRFGLVKDGITTQPMTWFPMSLVPTFIGPLVLILHLLVLSSVRMHPAKEN